MSWFTWFGTATVISFGRCFTQHQHEFWHNFPERLIVSYRDLLRYPEMLLTEWADERAGLQRMLRCGPLGYEPPPSRAEQTRDWAAAGQGQEPGRGWGATGANEDDDESGLCVGEV